MRINRTLYVAILALVSLIALKLSTVRASMLQSKPSRPVAATTPTSPDQAHLLYAGLWRTDGSFSSTIRIKNVLVVAPLQVTPVLFMADGTAYPLAPVTLPVSGVTTININDALAAAPQSVAQNNTNPDAAFDTTYFGCSTPPCNVVGKGAPPVGRQGTSGRNQYYDPSLQNWNFSTAKLFPLGTERVHLRFEADFFNLFNHTNFSNPISNESSGNFGKITSTLGSGTATAVGTTAGVVGGGARIIQGSLRLVF